MLKVLEVAVILSAVDRMTKVVNAAVNNVTSKLGSVTAKADAISKKAFAAGRDLGAMGVAAALALAAPINVAAEFETGLANIRKVTDGLNDAQSLAAMGKDVRVLARDIPVATNELLDLVAAGGRMDIPKDELIDYTRLVAKMGIAFDTNAAQIGEDMGQLAKVFNVPIKNVGALADAVNYLDDNAISKGPEIIEVMRRVGGTAQQVGLSAPRVAALASTFLTLGSSAEKAATASNAIIRELSIANVQPARFQEGIRKLGLSAAEIQKNMYIDPQNTILGVLDKINALPKSKQIEVTTQIFGKEYGDDVSKIAQGIGEYRRQLALLNDPKLNGSVQKEFAIRQQTANAQMQLAKNQIREVGIVLGTAFLPALNKAITMARPWIEKLTTWIENNQNLVAQIGVIVAGFAAFSLAGSGVSFLIGGIAKGVSLLSTVFSFLTRGIGIIIKVFQVLRIVMISNPIIAIVLAIGLAVYLIYKNWGTISEWFKKLWSKVKDAFSAAWEWIKSFFMNYTLPGLIMKHWGDITGILSRFYEAGKNIMKSIWEGMKSLAMKPVEMIKEVVGKVRDFLPFSPAKTGPLKDLHRVRIIETIAGTMKAAPMVDAMQAVTATTMGKGSHRRGFGGGVSAAAGGVSINFNPTINLGVGGDKTDIMAALRQYQPELLRLVEDAIARRDRAKF